MGNEERLVFLASEVSISEQDKLNPVFLTVHFKIADNMGNLNKEGITAAFISDFINRQSQFDCLPVYVDMKRLLAGDYDNLGHMYSKITKHFGTTQFGSLTNFYSEADNDGVVSLYAEARFPKRELDACMALVELYELGKLCVSVELRYNPEHVILKDGYKFIDAHEDNSLNGIAIVSEPACVDAVALDMVAERSADDSLIDAEDEESKDRGETNLMKDKEEMTAEVQEETVVAEEKPVEETAVDEAASEDSENAVAEAEQKGDVAVAEDNNDGDPETDPDDADDGAEKDPTSDEQEVATAEVLEHSVDVHESVENWGEGKPVHVIEYRERVIETMEEAGVVIAEQGEEITKLENQIAELKEIKEKYDTIIAEREAAEMENKKAQAKAFAEKQGLDVTVAEVKEAIDALDYTKIAQLTMAQVQEEEEPTEKPETLVYTLASFVDMEVEDDKAYGGLLKRRGNK